MDEITKEKCERNPRSDPWITPTERSKREEEKQINAVWRESSVR